MPVLRPVRVAAIQATPVILDAERDGREGRAPARGGRRRRRRARRAAGDVRLGLPERALGEGRGGVQRRRRAVGAHVGERRRRPRPARRRARRGVRAASTCTPSIGVNERESGRPGSLWNAMLVARPRRPPAQAPQADADPARAALPRHRPRRRPARGGHAGRPRRRAHLLGEPDAARALGGLPRRRAGLRRARPRTTPTAGSPPCATSRSSPAPSSSARRSTSRARPSRRTSRSQIDRDTVYGRGGALIADPALGRGRRRAAVRRRGHAWRSTATCAAGCTPSAGSTPSATTPATTSSGPRRPPPSTRRAERRPRPQRHVDALRGLAPHATPARRGPRRRHEPYEHLHHAPLRAPRRHGGDSGPDRSRASARPRCRTPIGFGAVGRPQLTRRLMDIVASAVPRGGHHRGARRRRPTSPPSRGGRASTAPSAPIPATSRRQVDAYVVGVQRGHRGPGPGERGRDDQALGRLRRAGRTASTATTSTAASRPSRASAFALAPRAVHRRVRPGHGRDHAHLLDPQGPRVPTARACRRSAPASTPSCCATCCAADAASTASSCPTSGSPATARRSAARPVRRRRSSGRGASACRGASRTGRWCERFALAITAGVYQSAARTSPPTSSRSRAGLLTESGSTSRPAGARQRFRLGLFENPYVDPARGCGAGNARFRRSATTPRPPP